MIYNNIQHITPKEFEKALSFAQAFTDQLAYSIKKDAKEYSGSLSTAYQRLRVLRQMGLAKFNRDAFEIKSNVVEQPFTVRKKLMDSLIALKNARRFGKYYNESDINFAKKHLPEKFLTTLDYAAWELTKYQTPAEFFIYVEDIGKAAKFLLGNNFSEGKNGNVILLPKVGNFNNVIERIYLDCIAKGGRNILDGVALELCHGEQIQNRGQFPIEFVKKVQEDLPMQDIA